MKLLLVEDEIHLAEALKNDFAQKEEEIKKLSLLLYILNILKLSYTIIFS
ncbi:MULTISPECIES: hypothetical protein [unclassified Clostridium]